MENIPKFSAVVLSMFLILSCKDIPTVKTDSVINIAMYQAVAGGIVIDDGNAEVVDRGVCWSIAQLPSTADSKTHDGTGLGYFESTLTLLTPNTRYYLRAYAINSEGTAYGEELSFNSSSDITFNPDLTYNTISDIVGNDYKTIQIGSQVWLAENLKTTKFNDGTEIPFVYNTAWIHFTAPGYGWYDYDIKNKAAYGALYNWDAVNTGKLCPTGWHVPSNNEWTVLTTYLGGENNAGGKLKETGTIHWSSPNTGGNNETGFTALPGGYPNGSSFRYIRTYGNWWSSTEFSPTEAISRYMSYGSSNAFNAAFDKSLGLSVRCLKD